VHSASFVVKGLFSGKHKIVASPPKRGQGFFVLVRQKESYSCTEPDKIGPSLPLKTMKSKKENQVFTRDNFVLP
jgi:hypothetical protein